MKEVIYDLKTPIDGIESVALFAPSRKQLRFANKIKQAVVRFAMKQAETLGADEARKQAKDNSDSEGMDGKALLMLLSSSDEDISELEESFISACVKSKMCSIDGGEVTEDFFNQMTLEDIEGLFTEFLGNFITI